MAEADAQAHHEEEDEEVTPRSDFWAGVAWVIFGGAVLIGSVTMDRLEKQNINPETIPGLLPGLLGIGMMLLGAIMALRSWGRGAFTHPVLPATGHQRESRKRAWTVIALCTVYSVGLVGQGLPFWIASGIFITATILVLQRMNQNEEERRLAPRLWAKAIVIGLLAAIITQVVFQELFLVRLP
jgi:hypothetical protein